MVEFLIDVNLPKKIKIWSDNSFIHVFDLNDEWPDSKIWEFARKNKLTIVTKDADFSNRIITSEPPPKVVHLKIGNMKMKEFHCFVSKYWEEIREASQNHKLVNVYRNKIVEID